MTRPRALGMPTSSSSSTARFCEARLSMPLWVWSASVIWRPMLSTGFMLESGSWKIIAIFEPRILRSLSSGMPISSRPSNIALPPVLLTRLGSRPSSDSADTLLPEPDSPTRPSVSPGRIWYDSPRTARTVRLRPENSTRRLSTASSGAAPPSAAWPGVGEVSSRPPGARSIIAR